MDNWVKIRRASNGYIIEYPATYLDENEIEVVENEIWQDKEDELGHVDSLVDALWSIVDQMGLPTSRCSKKRVKISIEPGDKYEGIENGN